MRASLLKANSAVGLDLLPSPASGHGPSSCLPPPSPNPEAGWREEEPSGGGGGGARQGASGGSKQEVQDLKEQLEALRCQVGPLAPTTPDSSPPPAPRTPSIFQSVSLLRTASKTDAIRAELMSIHCCQGGRKNSLLARLA